MKKKAVAKSIVLAIGILVVITHILWINQKYMLLSFFLMIPILYTLSTLFNWIDKCEQRKNPDVR